MSGQSQQPLDSETWEPPRLLSPRVKLLLSGLVVFHLLAVSLPPLAFQTNRFSGPSPLIALLIRPFEGYGQFLYLNRGYAFFAPDPGPSRLVQAAVLDPSGSLESEKLYPDRHRQWPRLLYHRHFMLSEYLSEVYFPPGPPAELIRDDPREAELWEQARARYEHVRQSIVDHLRHIHDGKEVAIRRIEHSVPALEDYRNEPIELTDQRLYLVLLDQPIEVEEPANTEVIPAPVSSEATEAEILQAPRSTPAAPETQ